MAESARDRIRGPARRLRLVLIGLMAVAGSAYLAGRIGTQFGMVEVVARGASEGAGSATMLVRDLAMVLLFAGLWQLARMLRAIEGGDRFSPRVTRMFRGFALLLFLASAAMFAAPFLSIATTGSTVQLSVSFRDLWTMVVTGVLFLVARLLDEARRIEADLEEIV